MLCCDHFIGPDTVETWVHSWPILRGTFGEDSGSGTGLLTSTFGEDSGSGTGLPASTLAIVLRTERFPLEF
jgi:hypothetical protein